MILWPTWVLLTQSTQIIHSQRRRPSFDCAATTCWLTTWYIIKTSLDHLWPYVLSCSCLKESVLVRIVSSRKRQPSLTQMWSSSKKAPNLIGSTEQLDVDPQQTSSWLHSGTEDTSSPQDVSIDFKVDTPLLTEREILQHIGEDKPDVDLQQITTTDL